MRGRGGRRDYAWPDAHADLEAGVHPEVVAARLGEHIDTVLTTADEQGWPVSWKGPSPDQIIDATERRLT